MSLIETAIDKAKDLAKLAQKLDNIEIIQRVLDVQSELLNVQEELQALRKENEELKDNAKLDANIRLQDGAYYVPGRHNNRTGPFCTTCWDVKRKLVTLHDKVNGTHHCGECDKDYPTDKSRRTEQEANRARPIVPGKSF